MEGSPHPCLPGPPLFPHKEQSPSALLGALGPPNLGTELPSLGGAWSRLDEATGPPPAPGARRDGAACPRGVAGPPDSGCSRPVQRAYCGQCSERIWGLARQGYRCINCKLLVHKRCHVLVPLSCDRHMVSAGWAQPGRVSTLPQGPSASFCPGGALTSSLPPARERRGLPWAAG